MAFVTTSDPLLAAAFWSGVGALAATASLVLAVTIARLRLLFRLRLERRVSARWNPLIAECADAVPAALPPLAKRELEGFLVLWCRAAESLRGHATDNLLEMARRLDIEAQLQKLAASDRLHLKLLAVVSLGHLRSRDALPMLLQLVREAASIVSLNAARAMMRIDPAIAMPHVLSATASREDWALAGVVPAFAECDPAQVGPLLAAAIHTALYKERRGKPTNGLARLLRLHVAAHDAALRDALLAVLAESESPGALVAALGALSHPQDVEHARRMLSHVQWPVRAAAAKALRRLGTKEDFPRLRDALGDKSWWVRYRAAQALCALPQVGAAELHELTRTVADRFAADILRQALAEQGAR